MKRLLLSLCLVGAVFPGHTRLVLQTAQGPPASVEQLVEMRAVSPFLDPAMLESMPQPPVSRVEQAAVQSLAKMHQHPQSIALPRVDNQQAPLSITGEPSESPVPEGKNQEEQWVVVIRGATVHSSPSVSAPAVRFYSPGTELQLIDYQHGWFEVLDPATSQRGWVYEKYYLQAIRHPDQKIAVLQEPANLKQKVISGRTPTPHVRRVKSLKPRPTKRIQPTVTSAARYRYETVASIMDSALRR